MARDGAGEARDRFEDALQGIASELDEDAILTLLSSPDRATRVFALEQRRELRDPRAVPPLLALSSDEDAVVRILTVRSFASLREVRVFDALTSLLERDEDSDVRAEAALALGVLRDARAVEPLLAALDRTGQADRVRTDAIAALGSLGDPRAVPRLGELLDDESVGGDAALALGSIGEAALGVLLDAFTAGSNEFPGPVGEALMAIGAPAVEPLAQLVESRRYPAWARAAQVLGRIGDPRGAPALLAVLASHEGFDRSRAAAALAGIEDPAVESALLAAFEAGDHPAIAGAHRFFVRRGTAGTEDRLLEALRKEGSVSMAEALLNCGNARLAEGARAWAAGEGYEIHDLPMMGGGPAWGGR